MSNGTGTAVQARNTALLAGFLPALKVKRKQEQALAFGRRDGGHPSVVRHHVASGCDLDPRRHGDRRDGAGRPDGHRDAGIGGAAFFLGNNLAAVPDQTVDRCRMVSTMRRRAPSRCRPVPAAVRSPGLGTGYLDVPQDGFYNIAVTAMPGQQ